MFFILKYFISRYLQVNKWIQEEKKGAELNKLKPIRGSYTDIDLSNADVLASTLLNFGIHRCFHQVIVAELHRCSAKPESELTDKAINSFPESVYSRNLAYVTSNKRSGYLPPAQK